MIQVQIRNIQRNFLFRPFKKHLLCFVFGSGLCDICIDCTCSKLCLLYKLCKCTAKKSTVAQAVYVDVQKISSYTGAARVHAKNWHNLGEKVGRV